MNTGPIHTESAQDRATAEEQEPSISFRDVQVSRLVLPALGAERGGDWCEAFQIDEDTVALSIGDVCGHGAEKYDTMLHLSTVIKTAVRRDGDPGNALIEANEALSVYDPDEQATAIIGILTISERRITWSNAGHVAPIIVGVHGARMVDGPTCNVPLGVIAAGYRPTTHSVTLPASTLLLLYTDGVIESDRKPLEGLARLTDAAIFAYNFASFPTALVIQKQMCLDGRNPDDAAILAVWTPPTAPFPTTDVIGENQLLGAVQI